MLKGWFGKFGKKQEEAEEPAAHAEPEVQAADAKSGQPEIAEPAPAAADAQNDAAADWDDEAGLSEETIPEAAQGAFVPPSPEPKAETVEEVVADLAAGALADDGSPASEPAAPMPEQALFEDVPASEEPQMAGSPEKKKGFFAKLREGLTKTRDALSDKVDAVFANFRSVDEELFEELEEALIMADIGVDTSLYIIGELRNRAKLQNIKESDALRQVLRDIIREILTGQACSMSLSPTPAVIMVIGVNGVGKTTSIGKLAYRYKNEGKKVILAAGDTFRAAAIDQLQIWAERAGVDIVKHQEGADPSSVVFDAVQAAKARGADVVICDTAGRLHNKKHLMEELKKTARVIERELGHPPNEVLLVLDASTGQNALVQAREFAQAAGITGVILTKLDGTAKGGVVIALSREQGIGVKFVGVGEGMDDLQAFDPVAFADALLPEGGDLT